MKKKFKLTTDEKDFLKRCYITIGILFIISILIFVGSYIFEGTNPFDDTNIGFMIYVWCIVFCIPLVFLFIARMKWFN